MIRLNPTALALINDHATLFGQLADKMGVHRSTMQRWWTENSIMLTTADALEVIKKYSGLPARDLLCKIDDPKMVITNGKTTHSLTK